MPKLKSGKAEAGVAEVMAMPAENTVIAARLLNFLNMSLVPPDQPFLRSFSAKTDTQLPRSTLVLQEIGEKHIRFYLFGERDPMVLLTI